MPAVMKKFLNIVILFVLCLSFVVPVMPGIAMCIGEDGNSSIVNTSDDDCCAHEEHEESTDLSLKDVAKNICTDIQLSFEAGSKRLSTEHNTIKSISSYSILDTPAFPRTIQTEKLVAAHSPPQDFSITTIRTTILLV